MACRAKRIAAADSAMRDSKPSVVGRKMPAAEVEKRGLPHVSHGNYSHSQRAIEAYLHSMGTPRHTYTAELLMFMERSFKGKYRDGKRSHYQRIMPSADWKSGDSLSEKLTRCKDKETFKKRFDRIGTTAVLRREHFINFEISNLDFKGRMYLRLIDTSNNNLSHFYRNDAMAEAFIAEALSYYQGAQNAAKNSLSGRTSGGKSVEVSHGIPEEAYLENPNPLLITGSTERKSKKNKGNVLSLVPCFVPIGQPSTPPPEKGEEASSDHGLSNLTALEECGLAPITKADRPSVAGVSKPTAQSQLSGKAVFDLLREAVLASQPNLCLSAHPTVAQIAQSKEFLVRFAEFFSTSLLSEFFKASSDEWSGLSKNLKQNGVWQTLGSYPEIAILLIHRDKIFTWYRNKHGNPQQRAEEKESNEKSKGMYPSAQVLSPPVPYIDCDKTVMAGRTFASNNQPESLEYQIAFAPPERNTTISLEGVLRRRLRELSIDFASSEARIDELRKLPLSEAEKYCC